MMWQPLLLTTAIVMTLVLLFVSFSCILGELKRLGDLEYEVPSQCVQQRTAEDSKPQVLANICLKINAKVGGVNNAIVSHLRFE